jgi:hypothetical protein
MTDDQARQLVTATQEISAVQAGIIDPGTFTRRLNRAGTPVVDDPRPLDTSTWESEHEWQARAVMIALRRVWRGPTPPADFYEDDEPFDDVVAAFERGRPVVTERPVYTTPGHLNSLAEGTVLRAISADRVMLAWCVSDAGQWVVTGERSVFGSKRLLRLADAWERLGKFAVDP